MLTAYVVALVAIPSRLVVGPLGSAGTPAQILGMLLLAWCACMVLGPWRLDFSERLPIRFAILGFVCTVLASFVAASLRPTSGTESRAATVGVLCALAWLGISMTAMHAVPSRERLDVLLRRLVWAAGGLATLGILQFATKHAFTNYIQIPGLTANSTLTSVISRASFARPAGTALHPLEFGAVLTMCLPLAIHYALQDTHRTRIRRWYPVAALALAIPISISRSAILSTVVALAILLRTWTPAMRRRGLLVIAGVFVVVFVSVPGLLGSITHLFTGISGDTSAQSRSGSFNVAFQFVGRAPWFGRGFGTFLPDYRILDDQYLLSLIETGIIGLAVLLAMFGTGVANGLRIWRRSNDETDRSLGAALAAGIASAGVTWGLFDAFSFPMAAGMLFLLLGCLGALYRLKPPPAVRLSDAGALDASNRALAPL
jgi:cell division protein FtsW (lipid II flippase)